MNGEKLGHILIIEDNKDTQTLLKYLLGPVYNLEIVGEFNQAIERAGESSFDLLLIDINLGEERTGVDLLNILRETASYRDVPMIAINSLCHARRLSTLYHNWLRCIHKQAVHHVWTS